MSRDRFKLLSKSRLMRGLQCPKSLYLTIHQPELEAEASPSQQQVFDQGREVGLLAQKVFPGGVKIDAPYWDAEKGAEETRKAIAQGADTVFEATFVHDGVSVRVDVLRRDDKRAPWNLIEVKSSTGVKPEHIPDVAIQAHTLRQAGLSVGRLEVMHLNRDFRAPDVGSLFTRSEVGPAVQQALPALPDQIEALKKVIDAPAAPTSGIGRHCVTPYECPFKAHCWKEVPSPSILDFPGTGEEAWAAFEQGIRSLHDSRFGPFEGHKAEQLRAARSGKRLIKRKIIREALEEWKWPLHYLDFETIGFAVPRYPGTRPYEQVPFQFSVVVQEHPGGPVRHHGYLHDSETDPREPLVRSLLSAIGAEGSIVAYNKGFEAACLTALARHLPAFGKPTNALVPRLVDPLPILRKAVYDGNFRGSFSLKEVAPALLGEAHGYSRLTVYDGSAAQRAFLELISPQCPPDRKEALRRDMEEYCRKDTVTTQALVDWLRARSGG